MTIDTTKLRELAMKATPGPWETCETDETAFEILGNRNNVWNSIMQRTQIWASGGGTQSTAIAALIKLGKLPKPDLAPQQPAADALD